MALLDYDNDGRLDLFFTNGAKLEESMTGGKSPDKTIQHSGTGFTGRPVPERSKTSPRRQA